MEANEYALLDAALEGEIFLNGKYKVTQKLAKGGMAWVYKALDQTTGQLVALKILFSHLTGEAQMRERFLREAKIQRNTLEHPNIVRVLDVIQERGLLGFTMEWCDSGDLRAWQRAYKAPLFPAHLKAFFSPLLDAVAGAHRKGIVHRDLKPQNILLHSHGDVLLPKITDFGIAKILSGQSNTKTGSLIGTVAYMAPEQMEDSKSVDHRADIYSLGVIIYLMATGRLPFEGDGPQALIKILYEDPTPPHEAPQALQPVILKCLAKTPDGRYDTCEELKMEFEAALGGKSKQATASLSKRHTAGGGAAPKIAPQAAPRLAAQEPGPPPQAPHLAAQTKPSPPQRREPIAFDLETPVLPPSIHSQETQVVAPEDRAPLPQRPAQVAEPTEKNTEDPLELTHGYGAEVRQRKRSRTRRRRLLFLLVLLVGGGAIAAIIYKLRLF